MLDELILPSSSDKKTIKTNLDALQKIGDYYLVKDPLAAINLPDAVSIENKVFYRHMGFIYLPVRPEGLTPEQIIQLGNLRAKHFNQVVDKQFVSKVYTYVYQLMSTKLTASQKRNGINLLDFGAGTGTLGKHIKYSGIDGQYGIDYYAIDINPKYKQINLDPYKLYSVLADNSGMPFPDRFFDVIVSLYVFHYTIPQNHIDEIFRTLTQEGILIFNLYRPSEVHRNHVLSYIDLAGFHWQKMTFTNDSTYYGLKHAPTEFYLCRKKQK